MEPHPIPTEVAWELVQVTPEGGEPVVLVAIEFDTPQGSQTYFMPPTQAKELAAGIESLATMAVTRKVDIIAPPASIIVPPGMWA